MVRLTVDSRFRGNDVFPCFRLSQCQSITHHSLLHAIPPLNAHYAPMLTLYYREGCHLCEDLEQQLEELLEPNSYRLTKIDIDSEQELQNAFNERVPVLVCEETEVCEHFLDFESLRNALVKAVASYNMPSATGADS